MAKTYKQHKTDESAREYESPTHKRRRAVKQNMQDVARNHDFDHDEDEEYLEEDDFEVFEPIKRKKR